MTNIVIGGVPVSGDLRWIDEDSGDHDLVGEELTVSITGAVIVQASAQQTGRPITLQGERASGSTPGYGLITRATLDALHALAAVPGAEYTITLADGREFDVMFRRPSIAAESIKHVVPFITGDYFIPTINLRMV